MIKISFTHFRYSEKFILNVFFLLVIVGTSGYAQAPSINENFVRTEVVHTPGITTDAGVLSLTSDQKGTSYHYMDGLGRSLQTVAMQGSPLKKDIVQPAYYDVLGKPTRNYLPYTAITTTGAFRSASLTEQGSYYTSPQSGIPSDSKAYSTTVFEAAPLNRAIGGTMVGNDFQSKQSTGKLMVNDASVVRVWTLSNGLPKSTSTYPAGALSLQESIDEAGSVVRTYTDMAGKTILSQVKAAIITLVNILPTTTWLNTYYVYNDYNELVVVIPPSAASTYTPDQAFADLWYTRYEYDNLGRQTGTKFPGVDWNYTIFDRWDRPVLTQDALQRAKPTPEWTFFKYDGLNRMVITGTFATTSTKAALITAVANSATRDELATTANNLGYTLNRTYPTTVTDANIISVVYYDNYSFLSLSGWSANNSLYSYVAESGFSGIRSLNVKGLVTGSKSRTQGTNTIWLNSVTHYDKYYQPLQSISGHQQGGTLKTVTQYAFSGEVEKTINIYSHTGGTTRVQRRYTYDHAGRPLRVYHKLNSLAEVMLSEITYNELGQPYKSKHHSRNNGSTWLYQTVSEYAIQGWMKKRQYQFSDGTDAFTQELGYHNALGTGNAVRYDGMITANKWKHQGSSLEKAYNYTYDFPKRLTEAAYTQKNSGSTAWAANGFFNESNIAYDANGNITTLARNQEKSAAAAQMDNLAYTYSGNKLTAVTDNAPAANKVAGFNDGNTAGADYTYNENGNLTADKNKGITSITYNKLDLSERVSFASGSNIRYTYSASGGLLTISYHSTATGAATKTIQYVGELIFENNTLTDIKHEHGRILANGGNKYQYNLTDHLGSTRVVLQEDPANFTINGSFEPIDWEKESEQFLGYDQITRVAAEIFDHTDSGESKYALRLGGGPDENMGPAKSLSVMPGDTIRMEVYGKYLDLNDPQLDPAFLALALSFTGSPVVGIDGGAAGFAGQGGSIQQSFAGFLGTEKGSGEAPPAFLNYMFFDRDMNYKNGGFVQMSEAAREDGSNKAHEKLSAEFVAEEPGYLYIYLSNDGEVGSGEAFFDDFEINGTESYIVQTIDYYPYGLVASNWKREGEKATKDLFQGKTYEDLTQWSDFHARQYDAAVGRWFGVDPQNQFASPYTGMGNNPVNGIDPDGEFFELTLLTGSLDLLKTAFLEGGLDPTSSGARRDAWRGFDPTRTGTPTNNAWRIDKGLFQTDSELSFGKRAVQLFSRFTWEEPTTVIGNLYAHSVNWTGDVERVDYFGGATVLWNADKEGGTAIGNYININSWDDDAQTVRRPGFLGQPDALLYHEYGHYMQSRHLGGVLPLLGGINSMISTVIEDKSGMHGFHDESWWERDASQRGIDYMISTGRIDEVTDQIFINDYYSRNPGGKGKWWEFAILPWTFHRRF